MGLSGSWVAGKTSIPCNICAQVFQTVNEDRASPEMYMKDDVQLSGISGVFPTSPAQTRFWYQEQTDPNQGAGNIAVRWEIRGNFRDESFEQALQIIVARHEILRTRLAEHDGLPCQEIRQDSDLRMGIVDLRGLPENQRDARIDEIARKMATDPFDLGSAGLIRITLARFAPDRAALLISAHHTVFDGFSIRVLGREIGTAAAACEENRPHNLPDLQLQYADYALWQEELQASPAHGENAEYWTSRLQDAPYFEIAPDHPGSGRLIRSGKRVDIAFPDHFGDDLEALARARNTSSFALGTAVAAATLQRFSGLSDISFGTAVAGRDEIELEDLIGVFINPIVLRLRVDGSDSLGDIISQGNEVVQGALAHGDYPFQDLIRDLKRPRDPGRTPLVSVFFALQRVFLEEQSYGPFSIASVPSATPQITHDLNFQLLGRASGWKLMIDYDSARFDEGTVTALGQLFSDMFAALLADPATKIGDVAFSGRLVRSDTPLQPKGQRRDNPANLRVVEMHPQPANVQSGPKLARLAAIWSDVLGLPADQCDGDFFDLGGHSIIVLRMLARVHSEFDVRVPLIEFLEQPTLKGVAASIENALANTPAGESASHWEVMTFRDGLPDAPVIVSLNQPFLYHKIARRFEDHCRVINLHIANEQYFEAGNPAPLQEIVLDAVRKIKSEAAGRPVILMGQCVDGLMGLSIAQALEDSGILVLSLAMVDSWAPNSGAHLGPLTRRRRRFQGKLRRWHQYIRLKARREISWKEFLTKSAAVSKVLVATGQMDRPTSTELQERRINQHLMGLYRDHKFKAYGGEVILFRTESHTTEAITRCFGWEGLLSPDTPVYSLRGWHEDTLLWHGFDKIADVIECRLKRSQNYGRPAVTPDMPMRKG